MLDTAIIPCGGLGTRLQPITRWLPKELLPVRLRPVLDWTLDEIADAGLVRAILITRPLRPALENPTRAVLDARRASGLAAALVAAPDGQQAPGARLADFPARA
ncbi:MAG: sugar phosphate nucleotidyltransferase [Gemmatimonadales bacterium]